MTINPYADHLAQLPCLWINLDESTDRATRWTRYCSPLFGTTIRVAATHARDISDTEFEQFIIDWRRVGSVDALEFADRYNVRVQLAGSPQSERYSRVQRRAQCAITKSHVRALQTGLDLGFPRFVISEDDAVVRSTIAAGEVPPPPQDVDILVHGGALPMAAHQTDSKLFARGKPHVWKPIRQPFNALCATMYEVTRTGAEAIIAATIEHPGLIDHVWGFALATTTSAALTPNSFVQWGPSTRNKTDHAPQLRR